MNTERQIRMVMQSCKNRRLEQAWVLLFLLPLVMTAFAGCHTPCHLRKDVRANVKASYTKRKNKRINLSKSILEKQISNLIATYNRYEFTPFVREESVKQLKLIHQNHSLNDLLPIYAWKMRHRILRQVVCPHLSVEGTKVIEFIINKLKIKNPSSRNHTEHYSHDKIHTNRSGYQSILECLEMNQLPKSTIIFLQKESSKQTRESRFSQEASLYLIGKFLTLPFFA